MSVATEQGKGALLCAALGIDVIGREGHDLKAACVDCQSSDGFRVSRDKGVAHCHVCKVGFSAYQLAEKLVGKQRAIEIMVDLGEFEPRHNGKASSSDAPPPDPVEVLCQMKRMPAEHFRAFGAKAWSSYKVTLPMYGPDGKQCSTNTIETKGGKGKNAKGKHRGVFLEHDANGEPILPMPGDTKILVEGPKDAAAARSLGFSAIGLPGSSLPPGHARLFAGVDAIIVPDRDQAGEVGAQKTAALLHGVAHSVRIATLPAEFKEKGGDDLRDVLGKTNGEQLVRQAIADAKPWVQADNLSAKLPESIGRGSITNATIDCSGEEVVTIPLPMTKILQLIRGATDNWPRAVDSSLFVHDTTHGVSWLESPSACFGWLAHRTGAIDWYKARGCSTKEEAFAELRRTATRYAAVEILPHEPLVAGHYYACETIEPGDGEALRELLDCFAPATPIDRDLIQAAMMTVLWGRSPGSRPAFVFDAAAGRGKGKSKTSELIAYLFGRALEVEQNEDIEKIKTRLLSNGATSTRIVRLDNIKSLRFSWAALESLITAPIISGKKLYVGEGTRPNLLTWFLTMNGATLSTDLAQRCVPILIGEPKRSDSWEKKTVAYIDQYRTQIIADLIAALRAERNAPPHWSRWAAWEGDILARLPEPSEAQAVIAERQAKADVEAEEAETIEDYFAERLVALGYRPEEDRVHIPNTVAAEWFGGATGDRKTTTATARTLAQMHAEKRLPRIMPNPCRTWGRGMLWWGSSASPEEPVRYDLPDRTAYQTRGRG